jgi:hypothetical protein
MRPIQTFDAKGTSGNTYRVHVYQRMVTFVMDGIRQQLPDTKFLRLSTGGPVNVISDNEYEIVTTGERITRA